ncbi:MAG: ATP-binding protein [Paracoccus denitrificans]|nr:MAG: ATP-binding protein [Paracoccus denitrificans]PZO84981.1 MAG: ATP-binding protein [Paracoccus denitrificans]
MRTLSLRTLLGASAISLALTLPASAETIFTPSNDGFPGSVRAASVEQGMPILQGGAVKISGEKLIPGQQITLMRGTTKLNDEPITVDADGAFSFDLTLDTDAAIGLQPIVVLAENPAAAEVVELKISPDVPVTGTDRFDLTSEKIANGLYQVIYSPKSDALFVTSAVGRPPVKESAVSKVDPATLKVVAQATPPEAPARPGAPAPAPAAGGKPDDGRPALFAAYGVGVDDAHDNVWVTNTRQDTIAVYKQSDLSLVKQFEPGAVTHSRDVVIDEANGRAYASATGTGNIEVFDTASLEQLDPIVIKSGQRGGQFSTMALDIDSASGTLVTVSMDTNELAVVDVATGESNVFPLPGAKVASGVAYDAKDKRAYVVSQATDNLLIVNAEDGTVLHDVETGAGPLNVTFDPASRLAYIANRGAGTITVVNPDGEIVGNLEVGTYPNQLRADGKGNIWAVNKSRGQDDDAGDRLTRIIPKAN